MSDINYDQLEEAAVRVIKLHQAAIMKLGVGEIAYERKKSATTVYAELNPANLITYIDTIKKYDDGFKKPGSLPKLGLIDFMIDMVKTKDLSPLVELNAFFNMVCFPLPRKNISPARSAANISKITQTASKECADSFNAVIDALACDGKVNQAGGERVSKEAMEAINALAQVKAIADEIIDGLA